MGIDYRIRKSGIAFLSNLTALMPSKAFGKEDQAELCSWNSGRYPAGA